MLFLLAGCTLGLSWFPVGSDSGWGGILADADHRDTASPTDTGVVPGDDGVPRDEPDLDDDGFGLDDCDDADPNINPGQADGGDGIDNDCDGETDEDALWDEDPSNPILGLGGITPESPSC